MSDKGQEQSASDRSTAYQAGGDINITNQGLSYSEVRQVALDVFRANFMHLTQAAQEIARQRANEISEVIISRLLLEFPEGFPKANDPDFQKSLFIVQREYATTGDAELGKILVDLLIKKSKLPERDLSSIILDEALNIAPKITKRQLSMLSLIYFFKSYVPRRARFAEIAKHTVLLHHSGNVEWDQNEMDLSLMEAVERYISKHVITMLDHSPFLSNDVPHLKYCGVINSNPSPEDPTNRYAIIGRAFTQEFKDCIDPSTLKSLNLTPSQFRRIFQPCPEHPQKLLIRIQKTSAFIQTLADMNLSETDTDILLRVYYRDKYLVASEAKTVIETLPVLGADSIEFLWQEYHLEECNLTLIGETLALANIQKDLKDPGAFALFMEHYIYT